MNRWIVSHILTQFQVVNTDNKDDMKSTLHKYLIFLIQIKYITFPVFVTNNFKREAS